MKLLDKETFLELARGVVDDLRAANNYSINKALKGIADLLGDQGYYSLTFERIRSECTPMEHLLVDGDGRERLYLGFNREGELVTDNISKGSIHWKEEDVHAWSIKEYEAL